MAKKSGELAASIEAVAEQVAAETNGAAGNTVEQTAAGLKEDMSEAVAGFEKTQAEVKANMDKAIKTAEEFVSFGQGNVEAFVKSGQIWAAGVQDLGKHVAATAQAQVDQTVAVFKALAGVKSLKEAVDLQTTLARSSVEKAMAETGHLTDASLKLAEQTLAPITARVQLAMEKFGRV
jgi:phasin family protein